MPVLLFNKSRKDVFQSNGPLVETTALFSKQDVKEKCSICGFKWHPRENFWEKFESLTRNLLNDMKNSGTSETDYTDDELDRKVMGLGKKIAGLYHLLNVHMYSVDGKIREMVESHMSSGLFSCLVAYSVDQGIEHQTTWVERPQQNDRVERKHIHILEVARALTFQATLPLRFLGDCITASTYLINRYPSHILQNKTPYELLLNTVPPDYSYLKVFGCFAVATNPSRIPDKFAPKGVPCVFLGYHAQQK
ncbi:retrovirus-related pol polyprotein from transposon TNT 1-94 [Tanacetum coccineum]